MKVVVIGTRGFPGVQGGIEKHCEHLYPHIVSRGHKVTVLARKPYIGDEIIEYHGVTIVPLSCLKKKSWEALSHTFLGVLKAKQMGCDILHIHGIGPSLVVPLARILGMRTVMTNHGPDYERKKWGQFGKLILRFGERTGSRWAHAIICVSNSIADSIESKYKRNARVIPNGVVIPKINQNANLLRKYRLEKNKYILAVGRLVPEKGFHDLIDAFNASRLGNWHLVIVGSADHPGKYSLDLIRKASENQNIILPGLLTGEPLQQLYSHAGLFILPSYYEGLPIVLLEALSYRLSCIASDIPANRNLELEDNRFFGAGNINQLSEKIKEFTNKPLTEEEKRNQLELLVKHYDWDKIADRTLEIYHGLVKGNVGL